MAKLAWMNRHYMKEADPERTRARGAAIFPARGLRDGRDRRSTWRSWRSLLPIAVGSVDRLDEIPDRVSTMFDWDAERAAALVAGEPDGPRVVKAFGEAVAGGGPLDREAFRAAAARVRSETGLKGRALFHPIRVALTAADSGPELDLAVPAIDRGAGLGASSGVRPVLSCAARASERDAPPDHPVDLGT